MAYVSVSMGLTAQGEVLNSSYWTNAPVDGAMTWSQFSEGNISPTRGTSDLTSLQFGDTTNGLVLDSDNNMHIYYNGVDSAYYSPSISQYGSEYILFFGIDEENQVGSFWIAQRRQIDRWGYSVAGGRLTAGGNTSKFYNSLDGYNWIKGIMPISYNWQSVPSISGKNGILSFSCVKDDSIITGEHLELGMNDVSFTDFSKVENLLAGVKIPSGIPGQLFTSVKYYAGQVDYMEWGRSNDRVGNVLFNVAGQNVYDTDFILLTCYTGFIIDDDNEVARFVTFSPRYDVQTTIQVGWDMTCLGSEAEHEIWLFIHGHRDTEDIPENNEEDDGTDPNYQPDIPITGIVKPNYGAINTGFTTMYRMSEEELQRLSKFLWSSDFIDNVKKFFNDPREIIVGLSLMPVIPDTESEGSRIGAGGIDTGVYGLKLTDQYKLDTYGYAEVKAEKGNFLDYNPYTKVTAHLPFVGEHSLDVNDVVGKQLTLKYIFDFLSGCCVAEIDVTDNEGTKPRYFFGGSCGIQIPTSSEDFGKMYSSILSAGATLGGTLATIATGGLAAPLAIGAGANMLANGMNSSPTVQFSSGSGSINGMIGCKSAYLVIEKPKEKIAVRQNEFVGRPSFIRKQLSACDGFTKCFSVHLDTFGGMASERTEVEKALLSGIRIEDNGSETPEYTPTTARDHGIIFMKCNSDSDVIGKSWTDELTVEGKLLYEQDIMKPVFVVEGNYSAYNYAYIQEFGRFYHITEQLIKTGNITEVHLQEDVLQSWKEDILLNYAIIERQENKVNVYFSDDMYWTQANKEVKTVPFITPTGHDLVFDIPENNYILTIAGSEIEEDE